MFNFSFSTVVVIKIAAVVLLTTGITTVSIIKVGDIYLNRTNPVQNLIVTKSPDEVYFILGNEYFENCREKQGSLKCLAEIHKARYSASRHGYVLGANHFTDDVLARLVAKIKASPEASSERMSKDFNKEKYSRF